MVPTKVRLQPCRDDIFPYFEQLWPTYKEYCLTVSRRMMALNIETCAFAWWLCEETKAATVADLGSGFTSYALRRYATDHDGVTVVSVDDNRHWLKQTAQFINAHDLPVDNLYGPEQWADTDMRFDLIIYDYASGRTREGGMGPACDKLADAGVIIFDDAQNGSHHHQMANACRERNMSLFDVYHQTVDEVGRFAAMGMR